ncbi:MAG: hypothetical protein IPN77_31070 [Sandaracinaceae bacterium]|nr:hypothetical protein [Sandaracinaceae bacterium]
MAAANTVRVVRLASMAASGMPVSAHSPLFRLSSSFPSCTAGMSARTRASKPRARRLSRSCWTRRWLSGRSPGPNTNGPAVA